MTITTKYNIGDRIFWMESNRVVSAIIKSFQLPLVQWIDGKPLISETMYFVSKNMKSSVINWNGGGLKESQVFMSKKLLLQSL